VFSSFFFSKVLLAWGSGVAKAHLQESMTSGSGIGTYFYAKLLLPLAFSFVSSGSFGVREQVAVLISLQNSSFPRHSSSEH
jgi:hypothetical protein